MRLVSSVKIKKNTNIDWARNGRCLATFIDLSSEKIETHKIDDLEIKEYIYNAYQLELMYNEKYFNSNYDELLELAKQHEIDTLANEVREKRNRLLEESDKECLSDRKPSEEMIAYRQALRDITKQKGFPYNVVFPNKPE